MNPNHIPGIFFRIFLLLWLFTGTGLNAQPQWFKGFGGADAETAASIASDGLGGVYSIGTFSGNTVFGSYNLSSNGKGDIYIIKSNASNGNVLWIRQIGSFGEDNGYGIVCDKAGNVFCTGRFSGNVSFGTHILNSLGTFDAFVARLDPLNGLVTWAVNSGGVGSDAGLAIACDTTGNMYTCGYYQTKGIFGTTTLTAVGQNLNAFVAKMDTTAGNVLWANGFGSTGYTYPLSLACDNSGDVYLTGQFDGSVLVGSLTLTAVKYNDIFVTKHSTSSGSPAWAISMGGDGEDLGNAITIGSDNQVYMAGRFEQTLSASQLTLVSKGNADAFVGKIGATDGTINWLTQFGGESFEQVNGIGHDESGNIYVNGQYNGICDFDGTLMMANGNADVFLCQLNNAGDVTWNYSMGGPFADNGSGIVTDKTNAIYCTGNFQNSMKAEAQTISSNGSTDVFVIKIDKLTVGLSENSNKDGSLNLFPNPAYNFIDLNIGGNSGEKITIRISDVLGKEIITEEIPATAQQKIDISELEPAVYFLTYISRESQRTIKFIKE